MAEIHSMYSMDTDLQREKFIAAAFISLLAKQGDELVFFFF